MAAIQDYAKGKKFVKDFFKDYNITELSKLSGLTRYHVLDILKTEGLIPKPPYTPKSERTPVYEKSRYLAPDEKKVFERPPAKYSNKRSLYNID